MLFVCNRCDHPAFRRLGQLLEHAHVYTSVEERGLRVVPEGQSKHSRPRSQIERQGGK